MNCVGITPPARLSLRFRVAFQAGGQARIVAVNTFLAAETPTIAEQRKRGSKT